MTLTNRRRGLLAVVLLLLVWLLTPSVLPLYDVGFGADEPYRYVAPPAGAKATKPPTAAQASVAVTNGTSALTIATSAEVGPQVSIFLPAGALQAPAGTSTITVTAKPTAPAKPLPTDGTIVSNVYVLSATAPGGPVTLVVKPGGQKPTIQMRAPSVKQPGPTFEHLVDGKWQQAETVRIGQDIYQTFGAQLGSWALVQVTPGSGSSAASSALSSPLLWIGIAILVLAGIIVTVRVSRSRS